MKVFSKIVALTVALLFTFSALAEEVDVSKLPDSTLTSEQMTEIFAGRSINAKNSKGEDVELFFAKDGSFIYRKSGARQTPGIWKVENNTLCLIFQKMQDICPLTATVLTGKVHFDGNRIVQR